MKKSYKIVIVIYFIFLNCISFAQIGTGPGDENNNGSNSLEGPDNQPIIIGTSPGDTDNNGNANLEGGDPQLASIDSKLWILILLGVAYSFSVIVRNRRINRLNQNSIVVR